VTLPTFVIGGAPKAGTTAMWGFLDAHPQVWMSKIKEPHFLTRDATHPAPGVRIIGTRRPDTYSRGIDWYERLFDGADGHPARGEASTHYLGALDGPELMNRHVPGLRLIFILRQPVERAYSHYWHYWKRGWELPPFSNVLQDDPGLRYLTYMSRYRQHLERYLDAFGSDRIHLVLFDDLRADPASAYRQVCRFIGVDDQFEPSFVPEYNAHGRPRSRVLQRGISWTKYVRWDFLPARPRRLLHRVRDQIEARNVRAARYRPLDAETHHRYLERFEDDIRFVEELTRPLPDWRRPQAVRQDPAPADTDPAVGTPGPGGS